MKLEQDIHTTLENKYNIKFVQSRDRLEVYRYGLPQVIGRKGNNQSGRNGKGGGAKVEKNRRETLNKARNQIIRLVNCNPDLTTFISLTYKENMQDISLSKVDLSNCIRMMQRFWPGMKYLYVLEYQGRGAIHYHMLCNIPVPVKTAKSRQLKPQEQKDFENYFREVFWEHGWVDIRDLSQEGNTNVGLYVSVYLVEDLYKLDLQGNRCYGYSRNLLKPTVSTCYQLCDNIDIIQEFSEWYDIHYMSNYHINYENGFKEVNSNVNYFDMYEKER